MKVSVIIPAYNEEKYIGQCLNGFIKQTEKADEIIVIDNNCTDHTIDIVKKYQVKIIKEKKQGMIFARNRGFNEAQYEIIARTDADTIVPNDWIAKIKKNFLDKKISALSGPVHFYGLPIPHISATIFFRMMTVIQNGKSPMFGPNMALRKNLWKKIKNSVCLDDKLVHEDIDLAIHINQIDELIKIDPSLIVKISSRRIKNNPLSFFVEYPIRAAKTIGFHKKNKPIDR
jgi:glycosyltransferase involved in cell wall biosynthesis